MRRPASGDALVLCYHAVSPRFPAALSVTPERFARQLGLLASRGYRGVTFTEAAAGPSRRERLVAVTFDDAYRSVLDLALPLLERHGWPATVFAPTDHIGTGAPMRWPGIEQWHGGPHEPELIAMSWLDLGGLVARGWEVGSHTCSHPHLTRLSDDELAHELERSREVCTQELGQACHTLAYPYGDVDDRVIAAAERAGYGFAAALPQRLGDRRPLACPRVGIYHVDDDRRFRLKISPVGRRVRASGPWSAATGLRGRRPVRNG